MPFITAPFLASAHSGAHHIELGVHLIDDSLILYCIFYEKRLLGVGVNVVSVGLVLGIFVNVYCGNKFEPLLSRLFSRLVQLLFQRSRKVKILALVVGAALCLLWIYRRFSEIFPY